MGRRRAGLQIRRQGPRGLLPRRPVEGGARLDAHPVPHGRDTGVRRHGGLRDGHRQAGHPAGGALRPPEEHGGVLPAGGPRRPRRPARRVRAGVRGFGLREAPERLLPGRPGSTGAPGRRGLDRGAPGLRFADRAGVPAREVAWLLWGGVVVQAAALLRRLPAPGRERGRRQPRARFRGRGQGPALRRRLGPAGVAPCGHRGPGYRPGHIQGPENAVGRDVAQGIGSSGRGGLPPPARADGPEGAADLAEGTAALPDGEGLLDAPRDAGPVR
mmetsp:Transcript_106154/g.300610  ORF Transcript_106154/g.300610 Transcript_106154/m.300610 type:complete len:272 (-) Transcript_106154:50-865(-)